MPRSTLNSITASLDWDDFMASSFGETNTSSVATTSSASQPIFSISSETLSQAFSQALGQSLPKFLQFFHVNGATSSSTSSAVQSPGSEAHASNVASSSIPSSSTTSGNVVVPSFISTYSTVGNPVFTALWSAAAHGYFYSIIVRFSCVAGTRQLDLCAFGRQSLCSRSRLRANSSKIGR